MQLSAPNQNEGISMSIHSKIEQSPKNDLSFSGLQNALNNMTERWINAVASKLEQRRVVRKRRAALKELSGLSEDILSDIGITRQDANWAQEQSNLEIPSDELTYFLKTKKSCR